MSTGQGQYGGMMENYKGIMLCSRPQEQINLDLNRPFISRVHYDEPLGYNPVQKLGTQKAIKRVRPVLKKHRQWLETYSQQMREKFSQGGESQAPQRSINQNKSEISQPTEPVPQEGNATIGALQESTVSKPIQENSTGKQAHQAAKKPQWALSEQQVQQKEEQEIDALLDFAKGLDYNAYIDDLEVKIMLEAIKTRVKEIQQNKTERDDILASQQAKSHQPPKPILKKPANIPEKDWDRTTLVEEKRQTVEERLAKHIAEEILKSNKYLRAFHSKLSLQRILEMEAKKQLES